MAKSVHDDVLDQALTYLKTNVDTLYICSSAPTTYSQASSTYALGTKASFSITGSPANGSASNGRKIAVPAAGSITATAAGSLAHVALTGSIASTQTLLYVTQVNASSAQAISASNTVNVGTWNIQINDPT